MNQHFGSDAWSAVKRSLTRPTYNFLLQGIQIAQLNAVASKADRMGGGSHRRVMRSLNRRTYLREMR